MARVLMRCVHAAALVAGTTFFVWPVQDVGREHLAAEALGQGAGVGKWYQRDPGQGEQVGHREAVRRAEAAAAGLVRAEQMERLIVAVESIAAQLKQRPDVAVRQPVPEVWSWVPADGPRPSDMPPRKANGREFDGGPEFGNGSWAQRDDDGAWMRCGG